MNKKQTWLVLSALLAFSILYTLINSIWIRNNILHVPPLCDTAWYLYMSLNDYDALWNVNLFHFLTTFINQDPYHAPLFPATSIPFLMIFGPDINAAYFVNGIYLFILLYSVFHITEELSGRKAAILSAFFIATFPAVIAFSRDYLFEFPLAALTALSYLFLIRSDSFSRRKYSILFGIFSGLSILTKTMGMIFFVLPFFYAIFTFFTTKSSSSVRKNIIVSFLIAFLITLLFYAPNFKKIFWYLFEFGYGEGSKPYTVGIPTLLSFKNWAIYLRAVTWRGISISYALLFFISGIAALFMKDKKFLKGYFVVWLWLLCGYILLSLSPNKGGERYALPVLAPFAILMATHMINISLKPLRYCIVALAVLIGSVNYIYQTNSEACKYRHIYYKDNHILLPIHIACYVKDIDGLGVPYNKNWDIMPILQYMDSFNQSDIGPINILIAVDHYFLNGSNIHLYTKLGQLKGLLHSKFIIEGLANKPYQEDDIKLLIYKSHFIITKTGFQGPDFSNTKNHLVTDLLKDIAPVKSFIMSDGSTVSIYQGIDYKR